MAVGKYGVTEQKTARDPLDVHVEQLQHVGFTVVDSGFSPADLEVFRGALDALLAKHRETSGGLERLAKLGEAELVRAPLAFDDRFLGVANTPRIVEIARRLMGAYIVLMQQNGIINAPSDKPPHQGQWHRDLPYQHFVSTRPIAINALLCVDPFEPEVGSTWVLPGSHKEEAFPSEAYVEHAQVQIRAAAGSYLVMNSMLYHKAGWNQSKRMRRAVNNVYTPAFVKQQISLPALLKGKWSEDPALNKLLGYDTDPPASVADYLARREGRTAPS